MHPDVRVNERGVVYSLNPLHIPVPILEGRLAAKQGVGHEGCICFYIKKATLGQFKLRVGLHYSLKGLATL